MLLRGIVTRERKEEAHRDQEKKLALSELQKLHVQSDTLVKQLNYLGEPVVKLTDKERSLFKQPDITINDNNISISAERPSSPVRRRDDPCANAFCFTRTRACSHSCPGQQSCSRYVCHACARPLLQPPRLPHRNPLRLQPPVASCNTHSCRRKTG